MSVGHLAKKCNPSLYLRLVNTPSRRRRRGPQLEAALLDAAWDELVDVGFPKLTMESVAARANTGIAVLYRRWPNKDQLVLAALKHYRDTHPVDLPDTGTLRGDLVAALTAMGVARAGLFAITAATAFAGLLASSGLTPAQARERILGGQQAPRVQAIYQRAHDRGEIDLDRIPAAVLAMPFDLVRHDVLMDPPKPLKPARIQAIVDELFLPLVHEHSNGPSRRPDSNRRPLHSERQGLEAQDLADHRFGFGH
jgi:AcrR family transcriptional regulator